MGEADEDDAFSDAMDGRVSVDEQGNLVIRGASKSDSGRYICVASNMVGTRESRAARLGVHGEFFQLFIWSHKVFR